MPHNSAGRVQPIRFGQMAQPAKCWICQRIGHTNDEIFADPQVYVEWEGNTYICTDCCLELAGLFDAVPLDRHVDILAKATTLEKDNILLQAKVMKLEAIVDALTSERLVGRGVLSYDLASDSYSIVGETFKPFVLSTETDNSGSESNESESSESSQIDGPNDSDESSSNVISLKPLK